MREGEHPTESAVLFQGMAFRQKLLRDGARQIISFHVPTEFVDLQNSLLGTADPQRAEPRPGSARDHSALRTDPADR